MNDTPRTTHRIAAFAIAASMTAASWFTTAAQAGDRKSPNDLEPISICLTFGTSEDPCVLFEDDQGDGWGVMDINIFQLMEEGMEVGDQIHVSGEYCTTCILTFCGAFNGFIFNAQVTECGQQLTPLLADFNHDGRVDGVDLGILLNQWTMIIQEGHGCDGIKPCQGDLNSDMSVDGVDLGILLSQWTG